MQLTRLRTAAANLLSSVDSPERLMYRVRLSDGRSVGWIDLPLPRTASPDKLDRYVARTVRSAYPEAHGYQFVLAGSTGEMLLASPYMRVDREAWT